ncbi:hypothetical protein LSAT2_027007 [Lamellibrachia satsuma]|nr:hypothetical protein LSAT2_027007 [Lamellibrachia satsuma]
MSSRALRKLHGGTDIVIPGSVQDSAGDGTHVDGEEEVSDPEIDDPPELCKRGNRKKNRNNYSNPFDLLCGDEDAKLEAAESENEDTPADGAAIQDCSAAQEASSSSRCKKKKKKKKKQKNEESKEQNGTVDDIEASIKEVNELFGSIPWQPT